MSTLERIFWISLAVLFYCYAGYGILLFLINNVKKIFPRPQSPKAHLIPVTLIVAAFNEKDILEAKIHNTLEIDYPREQFNIIFVTDGSDDGSEQIVKRYPFIVSMHESERKGKVAAINRAMQLVNTPVVVFSDANSFLNKQCLLQIVRHYQDPQTGGVAGEKKIQVSGKPSAVGMAEGLYWKYESFMKKQDAAFNTVVGAAGELFSIRTELFRQPDDCVLLDDFYISMKVCLQGYKIRYEPEAYATESPSSSLGEEEKRKVRISAGAYQSLGYLKECLNIFKYPLLGFQFISRRLLRWIICPPLIVILLLVNILLLREPGIPAIYTGIFYAQLIFYGLVIPGWLLVNARKKAGLLLVPFYFVFMNYCLVRGFIRFIQNKQTVLWEKSGRMDRGGV